MGQQGRFGKYGEIKRFGCMRKAGSRSPKGLLQNLSNSMTSHGDVNRKSQARIRIVKPSERGFIYNLSDEAFAVYGPYREIITEWFDAAITSTFVAIIENKPVAFGMLGYLSDSHYQNRMAEILALAVTGPHQRQGIGQMLLRAMEHQAVELHVKILSLHTAEENLGARQLFLKNGFKIAESQDQYYPAGQTGLMMLKELGAQPG